MEPDVPETELSECEIEGAEWLLEHVKGFVDSCDAEGLSEPETIEAMTVVVKEMERVINEQKEKLNG